MPHTDVIGAMDPREGDLSTLGSGLDLFGISTLNPNQFLNNCVSVTIAKTLGYSNVHEFWKDTLGGDLPDKPLSFGQIKQLLHKTGWEFKWKVYQPSGGKSAHHNLRTDLVEGPGWGPFRMVAYTRDGGIGHCVVSGPVCELDHNPEFTCYQQETHGIDVSHEVQASDRLFMFFLRCPHDAPQWEPWRERIFWRMIERRRDPVWQAKRLETFNNALKILGRKPIDTWPDGKESKGKGGKNLSHDEFPQWLRDISLVLSQEIQVGHTAHGIRVHVPIKCASS